MNSQRPIVEKALTGQVSARRGWFGKFIVQVEVAHDHYYPTPPPPNGDATEWRKKMYIGRHTRWRDATAEDINKLHLGARAVSVL